MRWFIKQKRLPGIPAPGWRDLWRAFWDDADPNRRWLTVPEWEAKRLRRMHRWSAFWRALWYAAPVRRLHTPILAFLNMWIWAGPLALLTLIYLIQWEREVGAFAYVEGRVLGTGTVQPTPVWVAWNATPPQPAVAGGFAEDGTFDVDRLLGAWARQGISRRDGAKAVNWVCSEMLTLHVRTDPGRHEQMQADFQARQEGEEAWMRQFAPVDAPPARVRSPKTLEEEVRWRWEVEESLEKVLALHHGNRPTPASWEQAWESWQAIQEKHGDQVLEPAVLAVGKDAQGQWSAQRMVRGWQEAGLRPADAMTLWPLVLAVLQDWSWGADPRLARQGYASAREASLRLARDYDAFFTRAPAPRTTMLPAFVPALDGALAGLPELLAEQEHGRWRWQQEKERAFWAQLDALTASGQALAPPPAGLTMQEAKREIERVAVEVGLRSLRLPVVLFSTPASVWNTAKTLERANYELEQLTGWSGPVLGLGGRLDLTIASPIMAWADGLVAPNPDGRIQMVTTWAALDHEWFHALDFVARQNAVERWVSYRPLTEGLMWVERPRLPAVVAAAQAIDAAMQDPARAWTRTRTAQSNPYWSRTSESAAFAFSGWVARQQSPLLRNRGLAIERIFAAHRVPGDEEIERLGPLYQAYFRSLDGMDWTGRSGSATPQPRTPGRWAQQQGMLWQ